MRFGQVSLKTRLRKIFVESFFWDFKQVLTLAFLGARLWPRSVWDSIVFLPLSAIHFDYDIEMELVCNLNSEASPRGIIDANSRA